MRLLRSTIILGCILAGLVAVPAGANPVNIDISSDSGTPVSTVRHEITNFANRFGNPVIIHGPLNLDAPISIAYNDGVSGDQAINLLSQAAGGKAVRVYFVTPATGVGITTRSDASKLIGNMGDISIDLHAVSARSAIVAVASADRAQVRFPDGVPSGNVNFGTTSMPLSLAIAHVAKVTNTHWSLGYLVEPLVANQRYYSSPRSNVATTTEVTPEQSRSAQPVVTGDSTAETVAPKFVGGHTTSGDSTAGPMQIGMVSHSASTQRSPYVLTNLPPIKPLARDANGNILPFPVHFPVVKPATAAQIAAENAQNNAANANSTQTAQQAALIAEQQAALNAYITSHSPMMPGTGVIQSPPAGSDNPYGDFGTTTYSAPGGGFYLTPGTGY